MYCPKCGKQAEKSSRFCSGCGNDIGTNLEFIDDTVTVNIQKAKNPIRKLFLVVIASVAVAITVIILITQLGNRAPSDLIVGIWENVFCFGDMELKTILIFESDGTGRIDTAHIFESGGIDRINEESTPMSYRVFFDNVLEIQVVGESPIRLSWAGNRNVAANEWYVTRRNFYWGWEIDGYYIIYTRVR